MGFIITWLVEIITYYTTLYFIKLALWLRFSFKFLSIDLIVMLPSYIVHLHSQHLHDFSLLQPSIVP